ncbi:MAG: YvcK family protein, partial [bacterium]|nr:YvcK family protein [bacterium]
IVGRIFPSTASNVALEARLTGGATVKGETRISKSKERIERIEIQPKNCRPLPETLRAIEEADLICMGPGSLFTSIIPNLLVSGVPRAIERSKALTAYIVNLMWQPGETMYFTAWDHVEAILAHAGRNVLDYVVLNTRPISGGLRRRYASEKVYPVENDTQRIEEAGIGILGTNLLATSEKIRHEPAAIAADAVGLAEQGRKRRLAAPVRRKRTARRSAKGKGGS